MKPAHSEDFAQADSAEGKVEACLDVRAVANQTEPSPLSFAQEGIWFFEQLRPGSSLYTIPQVFHLTGELDAGALAKAFDYLVARHEALRTRITRIADRPAQVVDREAKARLQLIDFSSDDPASKSRKVNERIQAEAETGFRLDQEHLIRATILRCGPSDHYFLVTFHHIVSDFQSCGILYRELAEAYDSFRQGAKAPTWQPLKFQYRDWCRRERAGPGGADRHRILEFWRKELQESGVCELPADHRHPGMPSFRGSRVTFSLPSELSLELRRLSRERKATLNVLLLAAFQTLIFRYLNQDEVVVGLPISQREFAESEHLIGFFINVLPLRTFLSGDISFSGWVERLSRNCLDLYANSAVSFLDLVREFRRESDPSRHPLFQIVFQFFSEPLPRPRLAGVQTERMPLETGISKFDLTLNVVNENSSLEGEFEFSTDLFARMTIERMARHFVRLLQSIAANPNEPLSRLVLLTEQERTALLTAYNQTQTSYPRAATVPELFEEQCRLRPEAVAVEFGGDKLSYAELNRQANQLARFLQSQGTQPGTRVGLCAERSLEMIVGMLGILKAGGSYVPLDPQYPRERLQFISEDTGLPFILASPQCQNSVGGLSRILRLDEFSACAGGFSGENLGPSAAAEDIACVIYTSGSTGTPKGVIVLHRGIVRLVKAANYMNFTPENIFLQFAPFSFDASTWEIWGPLLNGGRLVVFPARFDSIEQLGAIIAARQVNTLWLTSGLFHEIIDHHLEILQPIRTLLAGGDVLSTRHVAVLREKFPDCQLINGYGPTENTTFTCYYRVPRNWPGTRPVPIGRPISNTTVYVLDRFLNPVPVGFPGELVTGGDGLALGYLNRPELSDEKFIPNPVDPQSGKVFRTGDIVRCLPDGAIEFLGRRDHQVKIRGFRVELEEIECAMASLPSVESAVVLAPPNASGARSLVACVIPKNAAVSDSVIRTELGQKLPGFMLPSRIVFFKKFPMTPNGKVDRARLAEERLAGAPEPMPEEPQTELEAQLAAIWREVLQVNSISRRDNFFNLGGHSLLATRIVSRVNHEFQRSLSLSVLFEAPTIAQLAERIAAAASVVPAPLKSRSRAAWLDTKSP